MPNVELQSLNEAFQIPDNNALLAALRQIADATQNARCYIALDIDEGYAAYNETAEAVLHARKLIALAEAA